MSLNHNVKTKSIELLNEWYDLILMLFELFAVFIFFSLIRKF